MLLDAMFRQSKLAQDREAEEAQNAPLLPEGESAAKINRYQEFMEKKLKPQQAEF